MMRVLKSLKRDVTHPAITTLSKFSNPPPPPHGTTLEYFLLGLLVGRKIIVPVSLWLKDRTLKIKKSSVEKKHSYKYTVFEKYLYTVLHVKNVTNDDRVKHPLLLPYYLPRSIFGECKLLFPCMLFM